MLRAAVSAATGATRIAAVTVLTSLDADELAEIGLGRPEAATDRLARLALDAGCRALVCSPLEVARVRSLAGPEVTLVCPGVRPAEAGEGEASRGGGRAGGRVDDQARVATPAAALAAGADLLVIGRPITRAADPAAAAGALSAEALAGRGGSR
jgi:orotidine-5'-phosphate decarboxylase